MTDPITRLNTALEGRYHIERELGEGGMATVYLADDLKHERNVALKVLKKLPASPESKSGRSRSASIDMWRFLLAGLLVSWLSGCQQSDTGFVSVTDSAGVRISISPDGDAVFATVDAVPLLSIGGSDAEGPAQFFRIRGIDVDRRGRIWVADGESAELRIFYPDGSPWKTRGGRGRGPGEFEQIRLLGSFSGDSVAVSDEALGRLTVFDSEGELARTARLSTGDRPVPRTHDVFADGAILGQAPRLLAAASLTPNQILADTARLVRVLPDSGEVFPLADLAGPLWLWTGSNQIGIPFTANPGLEVVQGALHTVAGPEFRVRVFEDGSLSEVYGISREAQAVRQDDIDTYRRTMEEYLPEQMVAAYLSILDHPARPAVLPAYLDVVGSANRNTWVQRYSPDTTWDVYGPSREWVGRVEVPTGFVPEHVGDSTLAGIWRDESQVEHVRVYRVRAR